VTTLASNKNPVPNEFPHTGILSVAPNAPHKYTVLPHHRLRPFLLLQALAGATAGAGVDVTLNGV
jgi:hypothetical protein